MLSKEKEMIFRKKKKILSHLTIIIPNLFIFDAYLKKNYFYQIKLKFVETTDFENKK